MPSVDRDVIIVLVGFLAPVLLADVCIIFELLRKRVVKKSAWSIGITIVMLCAIAWMIFVKLDLVSMALSMLTLPPPARLVIFVRDVWQERKSELRWREILYLVLLVLATLSALFLLISRL